MIFSIFDGLNMKGICARFFDALHQKVTFWSKCELNDVNFFWKSFLMLLRSRFDSKCYIFRLIS
jgi:hypothetical protein